MKHNRTLTFKALTFCTLALLSVFQGCSKNGTQSNPTAPDQSVLSFDYEKVTEVEINVNRFDNSDDDAHFNARIKKVDGKWLLKNASFLFLDPHIDTPFIQHLLDTFRTLRTTDSTVLKDKQDMGLSPPQFEFKVSGYFTGQYQETFTIKLGNFPPKKDFEIYAEISKPETKIYVLKGATIEMLRRLKGRQTLLQQRLLLAESDDIDEFKVFKNEKALFSAIRNGADWIKSENTPIHDIFSKKQQVELDHLTHLRVTGSESDPGQVTQLQKKISKKTALKWILSLRAGHKTEVAFAKVKDKWIAYSSERPTTVFYLYPETEKWISKFKP